uniref:Uncharacterized protein n=1 Tax=Schizaphis graminum TaxID=13262 RepID=A0A2S2P8N4_SCHGA
MYLVYFIIFNVFRGLIFIYIINDDNRRSPTISVQLSLVRQAARCALSSCPVFAAPYVWHFVDFGFFERLYCSTCVSLHDFHVSFVVRCTTRSFPEPKLVY